MSHNILFLCTGNSARSQMSEALLRQHAGERFAVFSAGTEPRNEVFPPVIEVMREIGIDISNQKPKGVELYLNKIHFEIVIVVCAAAEEKCPSIFGSYQKLFWPFEDPTAATSPKEEVLDICRRIRDQIDTKICEWLREQGIPAQPLFIADTDTSRT